MRKELEEILSKTVEDMTPKDARLYDMLLNHNKRLLKGSSIFMAVITSLALGFSRTIGIILGVLVETTGASLNLFYLLTDFDKQRENNCFRFEKGEKKEFKKANGFVKMKQLLSEYEKLHGKSYFDKENDTQSYEEYIKAVGQNQTAEQNVTETKIKIDNQNKQNITESEKNDKTL